MADAQPAPAAVADVQAGTTTVEEEEEDVPDAAAPSGPCPQPIHPGWCRHVCRAFSTRVMLKHAQRMQHSERVATGKCGTFDVFAEDERAGDGGLQSGVVEYFDSSGQLVGAVDTRMKPCGQFGAVPTCTPQLKWEESHAISIKTGPVVSPKLAPEVITRIVRQNFARYKACALSAIGARPVGTVVAKISIAADGSVTSVTDDGSDLPNHEAIACIVKAMQSITFPQPEGGATTARVPIVFSH